MTPDNNLFAAIQVSGTDRSEFLQGQLTQDIALLTPETPLLAGWNTAKGRLLALLWLVEWQDCIWLLLPTEIRDPVARRLSMFVLRADVQISCPDTPVSTVDASAVRPENNALSGCIYSDNSCTLVLSSGTGLCLGASGDSPLDATAWRLRNISHGIPTVWSATQEEFLPQMVNLDLLGGISFKKGCYVGQEIVARTHNLGRIKRRMYRFSTAAGDISAGTDITADGKTVGQVVDAVSSDGTTHLLAVMRIESVDSELSLPDGSALNRQPLPYPVPEAD